MYGVGVRRRIIDRFFGNKTIRKSINDEGSGKTTVVKELANNGLKYRDSPDMSIEAGHMEVRHWLDWEERDNEIIKQPKMFVLDHCINTIDFMSKYSRGDPETPSGDIKHTAKILEKWKDFPDCVRYFATSNPHYIEPYKPKPDDNRRSY